VTNSFFLEKSQSKLNILGVSSRVIDNNTLALFDIIL